MGPENRGWDIWVDALENLESIGTTAVVPSPCESIADYTLMGRIL